MRRSEGMNMERLSEVLPEFPDWYLIEGNISNIGEAVSRKVRMA